MDATTLVLIGRTGNGKSSTANSILGRNEFSESSTTSCQLGQCEWKDGRTINVVDTPGLFDRNLSKFTDKEIVKCVQLAKDGVHGFILVLSIKNRFTEEEADILDILQMLFGPKSINYMIVVFTGADELENNSSFTFEDYVNASTLDLKGLIRRCNSRVVLFDNITVSATRSEGKLSVPSSNPRSKQQYRFEKMAAGEEGSPLLPKQEESAKEEKIPKQEEEAGWTVDGLPLGHGNVVGAPVSRSQWDSPLFACLGRNDEFCSSDLEVCLLGTVAPCMLYGSNVERLSLAPGTFANHCLPYTSLYLLGNFLFGWNCLAPWFSYPSRTAIRRKFNLEGSCEAFSRSCGCCRGIMEDDEQREHCESSCDFATHFFCHRCALCQEGRELRRRLPHPGFNGRSVLVMLPPMEQMMGREA